VAVSVVTAGLFTVFTPVAVAAAFAVWQTHVARKNERDADVD